MSWSLGTNPFAASPSSVMTDDSVIWEDIPKLADKIRKEDVHQKGKGNFAVDFVSWAKTAQLMNEHAPGWLFELGHTDSNGTEVHVAPDGSGYLRCRFISPQGQTTPFFPYAITDNRNQPIAGEKISATDLCNSHRRAYCAACAWQFNLAYQLWAREEIEDTETSTPGDQKPPAARSCPPTGKANEVGQSPAAPSGPGPIDKAAREELIAALGMARDKDPTGFSAFVESFRSKFDAAKNQPIRDLITNADHYNFCQAFLNQS